MPIFEKKSLSIYWVSFIHNCREYNKSQSLLVLNFNGIAKLFFKKKLF